MTKADLPYTTNETHDGAMDLLLGAAAEVVLSHEEVIAGYMRLRGIMRDDASSACEPKFDAVEALLAKLDERNEAMKLATTTMSTAALADIYVSIAESKARIAALESVVKQATEALAAVTSEYDGWSDQELSRRADPATIRRHRQCCAALSAIHAISEPSKGSEHSETRSVERTGILYGGGRVCSRCASTHKAECRHPSDCRHFA